MVSVSKNEKFFKKLSFIKEKMSNYSMIHYSGGELTTFGHDEFNVTLTGGSEENSLGKIGNWSMTVSAKYFQINISNISFTFFNAEDF